MKTEKILNWMAGIAAGVFIIFVCIIAYNIHEMLIDHYCYTTDIAITSQDHRCDKYVSNRGE